MRFCAQAAPSQLSVWRAGGRSCCQQRARLVPPVHVELVLRVKRWRAGGWRGAQSKLFVSTKRSCCFGGGPARCWARKQSPASIRGDARACSRGVASSFKGPLLPQPGCPAPHVKRVAPSAALGAHPHHSAVAAASLHMVARGWGSDAVWRAPQAGCGELQGAGRRAAVPHDSQSGSSIKGPLQPGAGSRHGLAPWQRPRRPPAAAPAAPAVR